MFRFSDLSGRKARRTLRRDQRFSFEALEQRQVLAAVAWDGSAGDNLWHTPANWSNNAVPTAADDVTIDIAANPTIQFNATTGNRSVRSLICREALTMTGGSLTLGTTAEIDAALTLDGGRLVGGTWNVTGGSFAASGNGNNEIDDVTVTGTINLTAVSARLRVRDNLTLNGTMHLTDGNALVGFLGTGTVSAGTFAFDAASASSFITFEGGAVTTFAAPVIVVGGRGNIGTTQVFVGGVAAFTNLGTITSNVSGQTILIGGHGTTTIAQNGSVRALTGGIVTMQGDWNGAGGSFTVNNGTLNLGGTFGTPALNLPAFNRTGGTVNIVGLWNNTTATLNAGTGSFTLNGGTINGGTLNLNAGTTLEVTGNGNNQIDDLTVNGTINLTAVSARLRVRDNLTLNGTMHLTDGNALVGFLGTGTVSAGTFAFDAASASSFITFEGGAVTTFAAPVIVVGGRGNIGTTQVFVGGVAAFTNLGTITSNVSGQTILIGGHGTTTIAQNGSVRALTGGIVTMQGDWNGAGGSFTVNNGTLNLGGTFGTPALNLPAFNRTGGTVNIVGLWNNTTATLNAGTGSFTLNGGTINGGTLNLNAGTTLEVTGNGNNQIDDLTVNGTINLTAVSARLRVRDNLTLNGTMHLTDGNALVGFLGTGTVSAGTFAFDAASASSFITFEGGAVTTFAAPVIVVGGRGNIGTTQVFVGGVAAFTNLGTITSNVSGQTITIGGHGTTTIAQNGSVRALTGGIVTMQGDWNGAGGSFTVNNGTLNLGGTFATSALNLPAFNRTGGTVNIVGLWNNTTATLNAGTGSFTLNGGTINGGTLNLNAGTTLEVTGNGNNQIDDLTVNGTINLTAVSARLRVRDNLTLNGTMHLTDGNALVGFLGTGTVSAGTFAFDAASASSFITFEGGAVTTFAAPVIVVGGRGNIGTTQVFVGGVAAFTNLGTITSNVSGQTILIGGHGTTTIAQNGSVRALTGGIVTMQGDWNGAGGSFTVNNGTLNLGGTFGTPALNLPAFNRTGGTVNIVGLWNNTTATLNAGTGSFTLNGGTINGGTLNLNAGTTLEVTGNGNNQIDDLTVNGTINLTAVSARLRVRDNLTLNGTMHLTDGNALVGFLGTGTVSAGTFAFDAASASSFITFEGGAVTTFAAPVVVIGGRGNIGTTQVFVGGVAAFTNLGTITSNVSGQTITIGGHGTTTIAQNQNGLLRAMAGGSLTINQAIFTNNGTITLESGGDLSVPSANSIFTNAGTMNLGPGSTVNITGQFIQTGTGTMNVQIAGTNPATQFGRIVATQAATLGGTLGVALVNGFNPTHDDTFDVLVGSSRNGQFATTNLPPEMDVEYRATGVRLVVHSGCPADFDGDGFVTGLDFDAFVLAFESGDMSSDFDGDGFVTGLDFDAYVLAFEDGC